MFRNSVLLLLVGMASCGWTDFFGSGSHRTDRAISPVRVIEPTIKLSLAVGGVAPGRDELILIDSAGQPRSFAADADVHCTIDPAIALIHNRPGFASIVAGQGIQLTATDPGTAAVSCSENGATLPEMYEVTIPPQSLIQILIGEARGQIDHEATLDHNHVLLTSQSPTADALGAVIRNRIMMIEGSHDPGLFGVDLIEYNVAPPASFYDAVINAPHQFSPTAAADPSYKTFTNAQDRNFLGEEWHAAYDQAVLSAAGIFNSDTPDSTNGAFGFRSPSAEQWAAIATALAAKSQDIPATAGVADETFPALAPLQILIHPDVSTYADGRPTFIFVRSRSTGAAAVTDLP